MYKKILVPLDGSDLGEGVLPHVEAISGGCNVPEVVLVRVVEPVHIYSSTASDGGALTAGWAEKARANIEEHEKAMAEEYLGGLKERLKLGAAVKTEVLHGKPADAIAEYAAENGVDLVIISTHGRSGISRWAMGSVADRLLRSVCVPVMMVRAAGCETGS